jgi:AcrR family transcriptional regulator
MSPKRTRRVDAHRNYERLLDVAHSVVSEQGPDASLREIARRAGLGLGTLYRHFPSREHLLEALLRAGFEQLTAEAQELETSESPGRALEMWLHDFVQSASIYPRLSTLIKAMLSDPKSTLYASCNSLRRAGKRLLKRAQQSGNVRRDIDQEDLFLLLGGMIWIDEQLIGTTNKRDHLFELILEVLRTSTDIRR